MNNLIKTIQVVTPVIFLFVLSFSNYAFSANASRTQYPVIFAHGLGGFDDILGFSYWGDDYGNYVLDPCDSPSEQVCNRHIDRHQLSYVSAVQPLHNSEVRGTQLADNIESYMATSGAKYVNLVSHSMGGIDSRKAADLLRIRQGYTVVKSHISISSPHRGSPMAKFILDHFRDTLVETLFNIYGDVVYRPGNDSEAAAMQLVYGDYEKDSHITGMKSFNERYSSPEAVEYAASILTAQRGFFSLNPALWLIREGLYDIDGNGYCLDDCDGDGAAGAGNGNANDRDDDGLVGINSQQQGERLQYIQRSRRFDQIRSTADSATGVVEKINYPNEIQMTSLDYVLNQDHVDVIGVGPDTFDEMEFYAAITDYLAQLGY